MHLKRIHESVQLVRNFGIRWGKKSMSDNVVDPSVNAIDKWSQCKTRTDDYSNLPGYLVLKDGKLEFVKRPEKKQEQIQVGWFKRIAQAVADQWENFKADIEESININRVTSFMEQQIEGHIQSGTTERCREFVPWLEYQRLQNYSDDLRGFLRQVCLKCDAVFKNAQKKLKISLDDLSVGLLEGFKIPEQLKNQNMYELRDEDYASIMEANQYKLLKTQNSLTVAQKYFVDRYNSRLRRSFHDNFGDLDLNLLGGSSHRRKLLRDHSSKLPLPSLCFVHPRYIEQVVDNLKQTNVKKQQMMFALTADLMNRQLDAGPSRFLDDALKRVYHRLSLQERELWGDGIKSLLDELGSKKWEEIKKSPLTIREGPYLETQIEVAF